MGNIKKKINDSWQVVASSNATGISVTNPSLLEEGTTVDSVDSVLSRHQASINKLEHNVSWLAKHGGGGSGSGGGSSDTSEATCKITVNGVETDNTLYVDENGLSIILDEQNSKFSKQWVVSVRIGSVLIQTSNKSFTDRELVIKLDKISSYLTNHSGKLSISASYEDDTNGVYGAAYWSGNIIESIVNLSTENYALDTKSLNVSELTYTYSVGIVGDYTLNIDIVKNNKSVKTLTKQVNIPSSTSQTKTIQISDILDLSDTTNLVGVYNITSTLFYNENSSVSKSIRSTLTIVSDDILISSSEMSEMESEPVEVSISGSITVSFIAYLSGSASFKYTCKINDTILSGPSIGKFGENTKTYIPVTSTWATENKVYPLTIIVESGEKTASKIFYIKVVEASGTFLPMSTDAQSHLVTEFLARSYAEGISNFTLTSDKYTQGGETSSVSTTLTPKNHNNLNKISIVSSTGLPYLRYSNGCYGELGPWAYNGQTYGLGNFLKTKSFTISICFKADYHPDNDRTIFYSGSVDLNTSELVDGISIDVHDIYIRNRSVYKLTDNVINCLDITCQQVRSTTTVDGETITSIKYLTKVYLDGVLTAVTYDNNYINLGDKIYLGARYNNGPVNSCDFNLYNLQIYDSALSDFDIMINYINNKVSTTYKDKTPNYSVIDEELKYNFCERNTDGSIKSYMFDENSGYSIDFLLEGNSLSSEKLNTHAKVLGIPIMLIDVSGDPNWTFSSFVTQQTAGNISLPETSGVTIQYWDPEGSNTSVINIKDVIVSLQGTSTLSDAVKNLNITLGSNTVFIPTKTWLPEQTYTLKADIVDSSHSNNASIGKFINTELGSKEDPFFQYNETAISNVYESEYVINKQKTATLKHTVEGFPVFLIMHFYSNNTGDISVSPLGIYSFNLGRNAYRNLGFKKITSITDNETKEAPEINIFPYVIQNATIVEESSNANWIEIKDTTSIPDMLNVVDDLPTGFNSAKGDFWQNDDSILNARYEVRYGDKSNVSDYTNFKTFVGNIMKLPIEGCSYTNKIGNVITPLINTSYQLYQTLDGVTYTEIEGKKQTIAQDVDKDLTTDLGFNTDSMYKYFVIALLFGLVDNFGKNSTYRSWDGGQYYIDFYDLDTALKGDNQGETTVGPDLWIKYLYNKIGNGQKYGYINETFNDSMDNISKSTVSANHNKIWLSIDTEFFRSYINGSANKSYSIYTQTWYALRKKMDALVDATNKIAGYEKYSNFADYFVDEYYIKQTKNCGPLLFNYDYKLKYLLQFTNTSEIKTSVLSKLNGRKIALVRDWLKKHITFLDSLFYWRDSSQTLTFKNDNSTSTSGKVMNTPECLPMMSNAPVIVYSSAGNSAQTYYFLQANTKTYVDTAQNTSNSPITWNFNNSPSIIQFGDDEIPLSNMNVRTIQDSANEYHINALGLPSITELLLSSSKYLYKFNLDVFSKGDVSELRVLDFSNTSGTDVDLNLIITNDNDQYTKFKKLTKIDISGSSCIKDLQIPEIPLTELSVSNSSIINFSLKNQYYLENVDLTGCTKLQTINLDGCSSYKKLDVSGFSNLNTVTVINCNSIKSISLTNCSNLTSIKIENCDNLEQIIITGNNKLTGIGDNLIRIADCNSIKTLDVHDNQNLCKLRLANINFSTLECIDLHNTKVTDLSDDSSELSTDYTLDFRKYTGLKNPVFYYNSEIQYIHFPNDKDNPIEIKGGFPQCTKLKRIYGHVKFTDPGNNNGLFYKDSAFSIHGNVTTWKSKSIKDGNMIKTPWEILKDNPDDFDNITWEDTFQEGDNVTNFEISNNKNANGTYYNYLYATFSNGCTLFDSYYFLCILALSGITTNQSAYYTFPYGLFDWSKGLIPSRYTFYKCSCITSMKNLYGGSSVYLYSPSVENGVVTKDNGLFSPLTGLTSISSCFNSESDGSVASKYLLHRKEGSYALISYGMSLGVIYDTTELGVNYTDFNDTYIEEKLNSGECGNIDNFFRDCSKLTTIDGFCVYKSINYTGLKIPKTVTRIASSFTTRAGRGTIDLRNIFDEGSNLQEIGVNSFNLYKKNALSYADYVTFPLANDTFKNIQKLRVYSDYCLRGEYLTKKIEDEFPYNIVSSLSNLQYINGLFRDATGTFTSAVEVPGTLFLNNTKLLQVQECFQNVGFQIKLTSKGFVNCHQLNSVRGLFQNSEISGSIPYKLFYQGETGTTSEKEIKGTNQEEEPTSDFDLTQLVSTKIYIPILYRNITDMSYCFSGCTTIKMYEMPDDFEEELEVNEYYAPFTWIYNESSKTWNKGGITCEKDMSWITDGTDQENVEKTKNYYNLDRGNSQANDYTIGKSEDLNYCCPPDLFRYCANSSKTNITYVFYNCGSDLQNYTVGMSGRIPPHLLRPLSQVQSITGLFGFCSNLYSYKDSEGNLYQIPKEFFKYASNVQNLCLAFAGLAFQPYTNLNIFNYLIYSLDIRGIFGMCIWGSGTSTNEWVISSVFDSNKYTSISGAFSINAIGLASATEGIGVGNTYAYSAGGFLGNYVKMGNNFNKNIPASSRVGYVYSGWGTKVTDTIIDLTINNNK